MSDLAFLKNAAAQLQAASAELEADNARAEYRRFEEIKDFINTMTDEELRVVFGGHFDCQTRYWMGSRLCNAMLVAKCKETPINAVIGDSVAYLDAVDKDEARFNEKMGRQGVRFSGD